jgi:hypothetical protein
MHLLVLYTKPGQNSACESARGGYPRFMISKMSIITISIEMKVTLMLPNMYSSSPKYYSSTLATDEDFVYRRDHWIQVNTNLHGEHIDDDYYDEKEGNPHSRIDIFSDCPIQLRLAIVITKADRLCDRD